MWLNIDVERFELWIPRVLKRTSLDFYSRRVAKSTLGNSARDFTL